MYSYSAEIVAASAAYQIKSTGSRVSSNSIAAAEVAACSVAIVSLGVSCNCLLPENRLLGSSARSCSSTVAVNVEDALSSSSFGLAIPAIVMYFEFSIG